MAADPSSAPHPLLRKADIDGMAEKHFRHFINQDAERFGKSLGDAVGMSTLGVHLVRLAPGKESTEYHFHRREEEFLYILSGEGEAEIGDERLPVAAGDFMGFTAPSRPHTLRNTSDADLVYLMGGARLTEDRTEYPRAGQIMYKVGGERRIVAADDLREL